MSSVMICDSCGTVVDPQNALSLRVWQRNTVGEVTRCMINKDICPECYRKLLLAFEPKEDDKC